MSETQEECARCGGGGLIEAGWNPTYGEPGIMPCPACDGDGKSPCRHPKATINYDLLLPGAIIITCPECGQKSGPHLADAEELLLKFKEGDR